MRVLAWFMLHTSKHKTYSHSDPGGPILYFAIFYRKFRVFPVFPVFSFIFGFFQFVSKQFASVVSLLYRNSLKESIFEYFSENLGLFRFVTKQFCLFRLFRYRFETPKQTEFFCFWFHETNRNKRKQIFFRFVSVRTEIYFCSFRGHPSGGSIFWKTPDTALYSTYVSTLCCLPSTPSFNSR